MFNRFIIDKRLSIILVLMLLVVSLVGCINDNQTLKNVEGSNIRLITDDAGREVTIPNNVENVYATSPVAQIAVYTIDYEKLAGLNFNLTTIEKKYTPKSYQDLPVLGGWFGKNNTGNIEEILKANPDIIIAMGSIYDSSKNFADELQEQIGIPVVVVDGELESLAKSYQFLGDILDEEERCEELANYCRQTIKETTEIANFIQQEKRVKVYYAQTADGLQTDPAGSRHAKVLDIVGGVNVAEVPMKGGYGRTSVSIEQILNWNPDKIIVCKDKNNQADNSITSYGKITTGSKWSNLKAVKEGEVYEIPSAPYNWFDRPPSVNRILGVKWLGNLLYPEKFDFNIRSETKEFYQKFYHYQLTEQELDEILKNSVVKEGN